MDANNMFNILGTFQIVTNSGPLDPLFIAEILQGIQEQSESCSKLFFLRISQHFGHPWAHKLEIILVGPTQLAVSFVLKKKNGKYGGGILINL